MRGRLIFPFLAEIFRLDTQTTAGTDPIGFDPDFKEARVLDPTGDGIGERIRNELPPIKVPCQVEPKTFEELAMFASGNSPRANITLVFHSKDMERMGLVDDNGEAMIRPEDRLGAIYTKADVLVQTIRNPMYAIDSRPMGFGLNMANPRRNLLFVTFDSRQQASRRSA
jgi:hypothetical protein